MIPQSFIQELLARVDIVDVVERHVPLKKAGANYAACCPFHSEKTPSFTVSPSKQFYHCFGCGAHGTAIGFVMEYTGQGFVDAVKDLAGRVGLQVPEDDHGRGRPRVDTTSLTELMARAGRFYREQLKANPRAIEYLKGRGLTGEIAARFGIGYAPEGWQSLQQVFPDYQDKALLEVGLVIESEQGRRYDRFRDRIMFPILDQRGNVIGFGGRVLDKGEPKYLNSPETPLFEKGRELYGLLQARKAVRDADTVIVVEGYMDVVGLAQHGVEEVVATLGTATTATHVQKLLRLADKVVFCFDKDDAGFHAAWRSLEVSLEHIGDGRSVGFLFMPGDQDPDEFVRSRGAEAFRKFVSQPKSLSEFLVSELARRTNPTTAEGKARLLHEAKPLVERIGGPVMRLAVVKELARVSGFTQHEVEAGCGLRVGSTGMRRGAPAPRAVPRKAPPTLARRLLKLLLLKPEWASMLPTDALEDMAPETPAVAAIVDAVATGELPRGTSALLLEHFRGSEFEPLFAELAAELMDDPFDESAAETLFSDTVERLRQARVGRAIEELAAKERSVGLDAGERRQLAQLLAQKQKLKSGQAPAEL